MRSVFVVVFVFVVGVVVVILNFKTQNNMVDIELFVELVFEQRKGSTEVVWIDFIEIRGDDLRRSVDARV